jgi:hypothetical protein
MFEGRVAELFKELVGKMEDEKNGDTAVLSFVLHGIDPKTSEIIRDRCRDVINEELKKAGMEIEAERCGAVAGSPDHPGDIGEWEDGDETKEALDMVSEKIAGGLILTLVTIGLFDRSHSPQQLINYLRMKINERMAHKGVRL